MSETNGGPGPTDPRDPHGVGASGGDRQSGRRKNPIGNPRTRFSILYFLLTILLLLGLNYMLGQQKTSRITYSEMKKRIAAGEVTKVTVGSDMITAQVADSLVKKGQPDTWTAIRVPGDTGLIPLLEKKNIDFQGETQGWLGQALIWLLPLGLMLVFWIWLLRRMNPAQGVMRVGKNRARIVGIEGTGVDFGDVAGADEAKQELEEVVEFLKTPDKFRRLGAKIPKGVLLVGAPGTGKTLLARAVAGEAGVTFFSINGSEFVEMFVGVGASRVRDLFEQAKANAPCIVFIDELDALGKARGIGGMMGGNDEREQTLNQLLVEMDGFDPRQGVIIMAATNRPEILDTALLRPGRFDRQVVVDRPDLKGRAAILRVHAQGKRLARDVDLKTVAQRTPGFVGADLANLLNEAALLAARREKTEVSMSEIDEAIDRVVAGLEKKNRLINDHEREIVAYHETGHAVVAERVEYADPVHKVSIVPRGIGALGYTQQLPESDRYLLQKRELLDRLAVLLGGRVAEEIVFGEISTGASNDLERASDIARRMVRQYGMSDIIGPVTYEHERRSFLDRNGNGGPHLAGGEPREFSEATAETIDSEVRKIVTAAHDRAERVLRGERAALDRIAHKLLKDEVIDRDQLRSLLDPKPDDSEEPAPDDAETARA